MKNILLSITFVLLSSMLTGCGQKHYVFTYECWEELESGAIRYWIWEQDEPLITSDRDAYFCDLVSVQEEDDRW